MDTGKADYIYFSAPIYFHTFLFTFVLAIQSCFYPNIFSSKIILWLSLIPPPPPPPPPSYDNQSKKEPPGLIWIKKSSGSRETVSLDKTFNPMADRNMVRLLETATLRDTSRKKSVESFYFIFINKFCTINI